MNDAHAAGALFALEEAGSAVAHLVACSHTHVALNNIKSPSCQDSLIPGANWRAASSAACFAKNKWAGKRKPASINSRSGLERNEDGIPF